MHLNDSQYEAFKAALTQEFTLIQGPPGTGKTYLGLLIAKALLRNKNIWINEIADNDKLHRRNFQRNEFTHRHHPMLVVCYTNHALDQFMEGIIKFMNLDDKEALGRVVRVGGRCSNQIVEKFSLKEIRKGHKTFINYKGYKEKMETKYRRMIQIRHMLKDRKGIILRLESLSSVNNLKHIFKTDENFHKWLGISIEDCLSSLRRYLERSHESLISQNPLHQNHEVSQQSELPPGDVILVQTEAQIALQDRQFDNDAEYDVNVDDRHVGLYINEFFERFILDRETTLPDKAKTLLKQTAIDFSNRVSETPLISDREANEIFEKLQAKTKHTQRRSMENVSILDTQI
ncbi:hypothetical protein FSP39_018075 [Pinctada imbricata]|uniref:DNA2/NAM7 helicase helicase domain-containing protein n=1 Tax=Pinctada imbricata TaxID=66713 RepID=A0AA88XKQ6_PINIB|nr:hypothetical protein FSP39_018075 [Pinctada imbricata]